MRGRGIGRRPLVVLAAGSLFTLTVVGGIALAQDDPIVACLKSNGELRIVDIAGECKTNETPLTWNVTGPVGPQGPQGDPGPAGPAEFSGLSVTGDGSSFFQWRGDDALSTLRLGPGFYVITFDHDVADCARSVTFLGQPPRLSTNGNGGPGEINVQTFDVDGVEADTSFTLTVWC